MNDDNSVSDIKYFKGNQFLSFDGCMVWLFLLSPLVILFFDGLAGTLSAMLLSYIFFFLPASLHLNYFGVSSSFLVVENHNRIWMRKKYYFSDIKELTLDYKHGGRGCLTIRLKKGGIRNPAGTSLSDKDWLALKQELIKRGVNVNDTLGYEVLAACTNNGFTWFFYKWFFLYILILLILIMSVSLLPGRTTLQVILRGILTVVVVAGFAFSIRKVLLWIVKNDPNRQDKNK
jgi:hypothetical protein